MNRLSFRGSILILILALSLTIFGCIKRAPGPGGTDQAIAEPAPTPPPPPAPEMKIIKISGLNAKNRFQVKLEWTGPEPESWKINRWMMMRDTTGQTQSLLVIFDQEFMIRPGEPRYLNVQAVCINPALPPARPLIIEYEGAPHYELTNEIPNPDIVKVITAVESVETGMEAMMPRLTFSGEYYELSNPQPMDKVYLDIVIWDLTGSTPRPFISQTVIEGAVIVAAHGGMSSADYATYLQKLIPGLTQGDARAEVKRNRKRINTLLTLAGLAAQLKR